MLKQSYHIQEDIIEWRRDFHMHPELGSHEFRTAARVAEELEKLDLGGRAFPIGTAILAEAALRFPRNRV